MKKTTVLLADDHKIVLEGLKGLLADEFDVVGTVEDGRALLEQVQQLCPDVIVVDVAMPLLNGIDAVKQIKKTGLDTKVVFLTMHHDAMYAKEAFEAGALCFVLKHSAPSELTKAIQEALKGNTYISPAIAHDVMQLYKEEVDTRAGTSGSLTLRQREVMQLLAEGKSAKEIANILHISARTVEFHKYNMMEQLGIKTSAELVHFAIKHGIVSI
ncbi:MAG: response regulator transcription factor [Candidatus Hydrogenedentota bacterium]|nr:MAG: response regulator transcription factor [Candidatus Hydrogenedentota bacterium]